MKVTTGIKIHNKFRVERTDAITNELKEVGYGENIMLDRAFTSIVNYELYGNQAKYFSHILFGTGTGTLDAARSTLFTHLDGKVAEVEETNFGYPISSATKKIVLIPSEYVGQILTEVGIGDSTTTICTHALIKDSEGNNLSITKSATDIITIYATVFVTLNDTNDFVWVHPDIAKSIYNNFTAYTYHNIVIEYLLGTYLPSSYSSTSSLIYARLGLVKTKHNSIIAEGIGAAQYLGTLTKDTVNKKWVTSYRFEVGEGNYDAQGISWEGIGRFEFPHSTIFSSKALTNIALGTGDGSKVLFDLSNTDVKNLTVYVDGVATTAYTKTEPTMYSFNVLKDLKVNTSEYYFEVDSAKIIDTIEYNAISDSSSDAQLYLYGSNDEISWNYLGLDAYFDRGGNNENRTWNISDKTTAYKYYKIINSLSYNLFMLGLIATFVDDAQVAQIEFDTAPADTAVITADYTTEYVPKSTQFVFDVDFEILFGEGTAT